MSDVTPKIINEITHDLHKMVRIHLLQIESPGVLPSKDNLRKCEETQKDKTINILNDLNLREDGGNLIVFPELSIPNSLQSVLSKFAREKKFYCGWRILL